VVGKMFTVPEKQYGNGRNAQCSSLPRNLHDRIIITTMDPIRATVPTVSLAYSITHQEYFDLTDRRLHQVRNSFPHVSNPRLSSPAYIPLPRWLL
jgi:hypothetical protein